MARALATAFVSIRGDTSRLRSDVEHGIRGTDTAGAGRRSGEQFGTGFRGQLRAVSAGIRSGVHDGASSARAEGARAGTSFSSGFSQTAHNGASALGGVLSTGLKSVGVGALAAGGALAVFGVKGAAAMEQTQTAFTSLLGSSKKAQDQIVELQKFAAATPFSQQDVLGYAQQFYSLAGSIGQSKDEVKPFLTTIGNLGSVTGASTENIKNAVTAIGQIGSSGKVSLDNLNQISEAFPGFNGAAAIASATGKTTAQTMKDISAGTVSAKVGVGALLQGMAKFPGAAGAMSKQSQTLNGLLSTFKDTISIALVKGITPLIPAMKSGLAGATVVATAVFSKLPGAIHAGTVAFERIRPAIVSTVDYVRANIPAVRDIIAKAFTAAKPYIAGLGRAFGQFRSGVRAALDIFHAFTAGFSAGDKDGGVSGFFKGVVAGVRSARPLIKSGLSAIASGFWSFVKAAVPPALKQLGRWANSLGLWLVNTGLPVLLGALAHLARALWSWVQPQIQPLLRRLGTFVGRAATWVVGTGLPILAGALAHLARALWSWVQPQIAPLLRKLGTFAGRAAGWITGTGLPMLAGALAHLARALWSWVQPQIQPLLRKLGTFVGRATGWIVGTGLPLLVGALLVMSYKLTTWVLPRLPGLLLAFGKLIAGVMKWVVTSATPTLVRGLGTLAVSALGGFISQLGKSPIVSKMRDLFGNIADAAKNALASGLRGIAKIVNSYVVDPLNSIITKFGLGKIPHLSVGGYVPTYSGPTYSSTSSGRVRGYTGGGLLRGPGTGTSDSILGVDPKTRVPTAAVSNGEFVIRKSSVDKYGPAFLHALNVGRLAGGGLAGRFGVQGLFPGGGVLSTVGHGLGAVGGAVKSGAGHVAGAVASGAKWTAHEVQSLLAKGARYAVDHVMDAAISLLGRAVPRPEIAHDFAVGIPKKIRQAVDRWGKKTDTEQASSGGPGGGPVSGSALSHARDVVSQATNMGLGPKGALIGLITALTESSLRNYANRNIPESLRLPHDAVGSDHYSAGIMQQQTGPFGNYWGSVSQVMTPSYAAWRFFKEMQRKAPGYANQEPGSVAQRVQVSAFPDRYRSRIGQAQGILGKLGYAAGGHVRGPGTGTSDSVPIMASPGEFVVNAKSTSLFGPLLEKINRYATGGQVGYRARNGYYYSSDAARDRANIRFTHPGANTAITARLGHYDYRGVAYGTRIEAENAKVTAQREAKAAAARKKAADAASRDVASVPASIAGVAAAVKKAAAGLRGHVPHLAGAMRLMSKALIEGIELRKLNASTARAKATLATLKSNAAALSDTVTGNLRSGFDRTTAGANSAGFVRRPATILKAINARAAVVAKFNRELNQLKAKGLSGALLSQYAAAGPSAELDALAGASKSQIRSINRANLNLDKLEAKAGRSAADAVYAASIARQEKIVARDVAAQKHLQDKIAHLATTIEALTKHRTQILLDGKVLADVVALQNAKAKRR